MGFVSMRVLLCVQMVLVATGQMKAQATVHWVGSWAASQQVPEPQNSLHSELLRDATLRQIVHLTVGGGQLRVRVSNAFGTEPLHLTAVHVARPVSAASGAIDAASDAPVTFSGARDVRFRRGRSICRTLWRFRWRRFPILRFQFISTSRRRERRDIRVRGRRRIWCMAIWFRRRVCRTRRRWSIGTRFRGSM